MAEIVGQAWAVDAVRGRISQTRRRQYRARLLCDPMAAHPRRGWGTRSSAAAVVQRTRAAGIVSALVCRAPRAGQGPLAGRLDALPPGARSGQLPADGGAGGRA